MRCLTPFLIALSLVGPAFALEPQYADGEWMCDVRDTLFRMTIEGETYVFTNPAGPGGDLALYLDGVTYDVVSGVLRDQFGLAELSYGDEGGADSLTLATADPEPNAVGMCFRPVP